MIARDSAGLKPVVPLSMALFHKETAMVRLTVAAAVGFAACMLGAAPPTGGFKAGDVVTLGHPEAPDAEVGAATSLALLRQIDGAKVDAMNAALKHAAADGEWTLLPAGTRAKILGPATLLPRGGAMFRLEVTEGKSAGLKAWVPAQYFLLRQTPEGAEVPDDPPAAEPVPVPVPVPGAAKAARPGEPSTARKAELAKTIAQRKARKASAARYLAAKKKQEEATEAARREYEAKMAPLIAKAQTETARLQLEAQRTQALQAMAAAQQRNAEIYRRKYILESQQAGVPQIIGPDGMVQPYPNGIAAPAYTP